MDGGDIVLFGRLRVGNRFALSPGGEPWEVVELTPVIGHPPVRRVRRLRDNQTTGLAPTKLVYALPNETLGTWQDATLPQQDQDTGTCIRNQEASGSMLTQDIRLAQAVLQMDEEHFRRTSEAEAAAIIEQVKACFLDDPRLTTRRWWKHFSRRAVAVRFRTPSLFQIHHLVPDPDRLNWLITNMEFVPADEPIAVYEGTAPAIEQILGECRGLNEFYVVGHDLSWLLGLTHHDLIVAIGYPALRQLMKLVAANPNVAEEFHVWPAT